MRRVGVVLIALLVNGCAGYDLGKKVTRLERSMNDMRAFQAEQTESINSIDSQVKLISGRIEELEFSQNKRLGSDLSAIRDDLSSLKKRVPPPTVVPIAELEADEVWANGLAADKAQIFMDALGCLRDGRFADALPLLQNATEHADTGDKAGVVLFWQGVAYDGLSDNRGALRSYAEVVARFPKSNRAPASLLRQASVLLRLGDKDTARDSLKKLIKDYAKSSEATVAQERLKELK